jgi:hypothetical protein
MRLIPIGRIRSASFAAVAALVAALGAFLCTPGVAQAHPIVSTDINRHVTLTVAGDRIEIRYIYEMLEIAAINTARLWDVDGDGETTVEEREAFVRAWSAQLARDVSVTLDGTRATLSVASVRWELGEGAFGLKTWKLAALLSGQLPVLSEIGALEYADGLHPDVIGWKEVVLVARGGTTVARTTVPAQDRSYELTDYAAMAELPNPNETAASALLRFPESLVPETERTARKRQPDDSAHARQVPAPKRSSAGGSVVPGKPQQPVASAEAPRENGSPPVPVTRRDAVPDPPASLQPAWSHYGWSFFRLGMHHIATGLDHMLFLLGLLLFRQSLGRLAAVITCFTLAHSVTLAIAAAGWITPPGTAVEVLIALSIAYVGAVSLLRPSSGHGPWIALGFGLVHGFGFAGALNQALGGVTGDRALLVALASFNLGIEALQLIAVVVVWPLLRYMDLLNADVMLRRLLSLVVMSAGIVWAMTRFTYL